MVLDSTAVAAAFLSTGFISLAPNVLLFLFPNYGASTGHSEGGRAMLSLGQALAVGGLIGDVFLHTLPDCFADAVGGDHHHQNGNDEEHHHHHHEGGEIGLRVILGFAMFLILDIIVRSLEEKSGGGHSHNHSKSHEGAKRTNSTNNGMEGEKNDHKQPWQLFLSSAVLLNLLGDSLHNFTDGLAIGATFSVTQIPTNNSDSSFMSWTASAFSLLKSRGGLASISVLLHEIPHELGDFATLVRAGLTRNMAIGAQFLTAIAAFLGTAFGLYSGQIIEGLGHEVLLPFTAGGFLYLACVTILPDVLETDVSTNMRLLQVGSFLLGVAFMYAVAELEEMEASHGQHSHSEL